MKPFNNLEGPKKQKFPVNSHSNKTLQVLYHPNQDISTDEYTNKLTCLHLTSHSESSWAAAV
jgi:hypothetical protein